LSLQAVAGRYRIERTLGRGGMAVVYLAQDEELARPVAVKVLADELVGDDAFRRRFVREARLAARLSHPNAVQVYDAAQDGERPFIVMEYVDGETLAERLARGPLPPAEATRIALQLCSALEDAHRAGLVHRDLKPQNVLLRDDGTAKLADFGIARAAEESRVTQAGALLGTAAYLAPEQATGAEATPASDLFSLGVVLYESLTGRLPHEIHSLADLGRAEPVVPVRDLAPDVPVTIEDAVMRCLALTPEYRPASAAELAAELAGAEAPTVPVRRKHRPRRRWPWVAAALLAGAVAAAVAILASSGGGSKPEPTTPPAVQPVARGSTPAAEARNLAAWLRRNAAP
jgi:eukaryotic-like serine/threonine-protein kinase